MKKPKGTFQNRDRSIRRAHAIGRVWEPWWLPLGEPTENNVLRKEEVAAFREYLKRKRRAA
jgi:hypothetical protein